MTDSPETKPAWEIAWEEQYPGDARHMNSSNPQPFRMVRERWRFQHGYETGYDDGLKEAELRASRTPVEAGVVTSEHRMWAIACWEEFPFGTLSPDHEVWLNEQPTIGDYHVEGLIAKAIADAEARGAARTPPAVQSPLPDDIANLRRYLDDSETTAFPVPRSVWEALERVAAAVAPPQEPPARAVACKRCNDTHSMMLHREGHEDRAVPCTGCPTPCQNCRQGGNGAYCETTPCDCGCHEGERES